MALNLTTGVKMEEKLESAEISTTGKEDDLKEVGAEKVMPTLYLTSSNSEGQGTSKDLTPQIESVLAKSKFKQEVLSRSNEEAKLQIENIDSLYKIIELKDKEIASLRAIIEQSDGPLSMTQAEQKLKLDKITFETKQELTNLQLQTTSQLIQHQKVQKLHQQILKQGQDTMQKVCELLEEK